MVDPNDSGDRSPPTELTFEGGNDGPSAFSLGPPTSQNPADDSAMMDDNDMTVNLLPLGGVNASHVAAAARRPHSSVRLVLRRIGNWLASLTLTIMIIVVPIVTYRALVERKLDVAAFDSAGVMVLGTVVLSVRLVYLHFTHWYMPNVQKYVVRILWMVPLYAIQSWLSLRFREARIYIDTIRDLYEAFVIASFVYYLIELLGGQDALVRTLRNKARADPQAAQHLGDHGFILNRVLEPWEVGMEFMLQCKHGVLQYVVVKTVATILTYIFQSMGVYGEGLFEWNVAYPYLAFILNTSVMYALYCLVKLFHAVNDELRHPINWHPLGKFLCVKGVVFFTWWQGVVIFYLQAHGIIESIASWTSEQVANGLIDYCVCIEMVAFAIAHSYTFTYTEYLPSTIEHAVEEYQRVQSSDSNESLSNYRPPETLPRPLDFRQAFWSSTLPSETFQDIRRLQNGVDRAVSQGTDPGVISMRDMPGGTSAEREESHTTV
eukprot:Nitzschia sp. Nitz4//scaffold96_size78090//34370//35842//NITZ4_005493-RA/size78090-processed-gene-0.28-mRNA-1//1//CDS//3329560570//2341//frame0